VADDDRRHPLEPANLDDATAVRTVQQAPDLIAPAVLQPVMKAA
jgi:hypothetical protein